MTTQETCCEIVRLIGAGDSRGEELLYSTFKRGLMYFAWRGCPEHAEDIVHEAMVVTIDYLKKNEMRNPGGLVSFLRTVVRRASTEWRNRLNAGRGAEKADLDSFYILDPTPLPDKQIEIAEQAQLMHRGLQELNERERDVLQRFYLLEQPAEQIMREMNMNETQFRLFKSRTKSKLVKVCERLSATAPLKRLLDKAA